MIYVRRVGPYVVQKRQPKKRILKLLLIVSGLVISTALTSKFLKIHVYIEWKNIPELPHEGPVNDLGTSFLHETSSISNAHVKCGLPRSCLGDDFAFKISSGAANVIGPKICFDGVMLIGGTDSNWISGINIVVIDGQTGELINTDSFDMWTGDGNLLVDFLKLIPNGSLVMMASSDDPATRLRYEARTLISQLGSSRILTLGFRDNWVFVGRKGLKNINPLEKHIKNKKSVNKYDNWPEMVEMEGCIPRTQD